MKGDAQSFKRATVVAVLGLVLQALSAAAVAIYAGFSEGDHAAGSAAWHLAIGVLVWFPLVLLFDLHRRERRESIEIERMALEESAGVFEADETPRTARALEAFRKYALPGMSLLVGALLLGIGLLRFGGVPDSESFSDTQTLHKGFGIAIGFAIAVVGFVFARFVSGMGTQRIWSALRAGASYAVGSALLGLTIGVTQFIDSSASRSVALDAVAHAVPIFTIIIGAETLLNVVLDVYRPRKPGEDPRPGFDSRLLGLLAAPDRIAENIGEALNYQFGVEVSRTWFYLLLKRWWPGLIAVALLVAWGMTSLVVVEPHQRAMVLTFGKPSAPLLSFGEREGDEVGPGLHIVAPWPMTEVYVPRSVVRDADGDLVETRTATGVRILRLGTNPPEPDRAILWTNDHTQNEVFSLVQPARLAGRIGGRRESGDVADLSLVAVEVPVQYAVQDVRKFAELAQPDHRDRLLEMLGERALMRELSWRRIDTVLGGERVALAGDIARNLAETFANVPGGTDNQDAGVRLMHVGIAGVHPPKDAARMFERVVQARQVKEANIEAANEDKIRILTEVAAPIERDGGLVTASDIVALIDELTSMREAGVDNREIVAQELAVQRLLEEAGGQAGAALTDASAERWDMHMGERGKAALFLGQVSGFRAAPTVYMASKYFEALLETMRSSRVYVTSENFEDLRVILELQTRDTSLELFDPEAGSGMTP